MTKECKIRRQHDGSQLQQRAPLDSKELSSNRSGHGHGHISLPAVDANSFFAQSNRRQRNMTWNRTSWLFCRLAVALSMIAVAAGHSETAHLDLEIDLEPDLEEEFFYAMQSRHQSFGDSSRPEKDRSLQFFGTPQPIIPPTFPPFVIPPKQPGFFGKPSRFDI
jgi:hypothetical protein